MPLLGKQWKPRDVAHLLWMNGWVNADNLMVMVAVVGAESDYYEQAWHWNDPAAGGDGSTDWGMFQENDQNEGGVSPNGEGFPQPGGIKTVDSILAFRNTAWNPALTVVDARRQYVERSFQPWAAYGNGAYKDFIHTACIAVCNFLAVKHGLEPIV